MSGGRCEKKEFVELGEVVLCVCVCVRACLCARALCLRPKRIDECELKQGTVLGTMIKQTGRSVERCNQIRETTATKHRRIRQNLEE